jgi:membrane-associated protein
MEYIKDLFEFLLHFDVHLREIINAYGVLTYAILFLIIFAETGFVMTPFLPGDSLIFAAATFAAADGPFNIGILFCVLAAASICGDTTNYWIGNFVGPKVFKQEKTKFFKKEYLMRTHQFYEKHGGKTIILAKFVPIIRTFAPFVAGIGSMTYPRFIIFNVTAAIIWVGLFSSLGYFFGSLEIVKNNFSLVIIVIIFISILPGLIEFTRHKFKKAAYGEEK